MKEARAITKHVRISPRKARYAADLIRGLPVEQAEVQLALSTLKGGRLLQKTLKSAVSNAEMEWNARKSDLKIREIRVDEGPTMKRSKPKNKGGRHPIMKRTSHFTIVVSAE